MSSFVSQWGLKYQHIYIMCSMKLVVAQNIVNVCVPTRTQTRYTHAHYGNEWDAAATDHYL